MVFSHLLKQFREQRLLSMSELARRSGLAKSAVSMLESGRRRPGLESIRKLEVGLGLIGEDQLQFRDTALAARQTPNKQPEDALPGPAEFMQAFIGGMAADASDEEKAALAKLMGSVHPRSQE